MAKRPDQGVHWALARAAVALVLASSPTICSAADGLSPSSLGPPPQFLLSWGSPGSGDGQFIRSFFLALDGSGRVFVSDQSNDRIQIFDSQGTFLGKWGTEGMAQGSLDQPSGLALDRVSGRIYVSDTANHRIEVFDLAGNFLLTWGMPGQAPGQFLAPAGIALDPFNNVFVVDHRNSRVQKFSASGQFLGMWGTEGSGEGQFKAPIGIATDHAGDVYVADMNNVRIQKFSNDGAFIRSFDSLDTLSAKAIYPVCVWVDDGGVIYVTLYGEDARVAEIWPDGTLKTVWGSYGSGPGQFEVPTGIVADGLGSIFVADLTGRIQKFGDAPIPAQRATWGSIKARWR